RRIAERTRALGDAARDLEEEIKQRVEAQSMLLQAQKLEALGQLTSGVAHDFNNVLAAISGSLELLRRGLTNDRQIRWIENGQAAVSRAVGLTRQLLGFARRQPLAPSVINLNAMLAGTRELVTHSLTPNVVLDVSLAPDTWPVMADPNQLQVALINLAVNARDAMPDGGMLRITTRNMTVPAAGLPNPMTGDILPAGQYVTIAVADTGIGMSPEVAARVLEPFFTTKALGLGTGLGLPMVYGFATQSGGTILIDSRLHQGTTVEIVLPRSALAAEVADETTTLQPGRHGDADLLVVDDDPNVRIVTAGLLRDLGYDVIEAASAETAYALASTERLDLIITDVMMARSDGLQLASRLRAEQPSVPILFVTGRADLPELKGEAVLQKPFTRAELAAAVLRKLRRDMGTDDTHDPADRLLGRIQTEALKWLYSAWRTRRQAAGGPPRLADLPLDSYGLSDRMFVAEVRGASHVRRFEYLSVGRRLAARLGRSLEGHQRLVANGYDFGELALGTLDAAYLRCCRTRSPTYEFARYDFGDGAPMIFERLLLPFSENGEGITHMAGVVLISERTSRTSESGQEDTE
ncbi:MAG: response regulator, partial [Acetobacteraceae bacterium]